jgi:hypothetical protein
MRDAQTKPSPSQRSGVLGVQKVRRLPNETQGGTECPAAIQGGKPACMERENGLLLCHERLLTTCLKDIIAARGGNKRMAEPQSEGALKQAIGDILKVASTRNRTPSVRGAEAYFRSVVRLDYEAAVKRHFDRPQLKQMLKEVRKTLPTLNREVYRITGIGRLSRIAAGLGVVLQAHAFSGSDGAGFRGFYVNEAEVLKRPLIWVNTAAHPASVAAAFWHEIGHHLTNRIWGIHHHSVGMSFVANYRDHLADPKEIAADMVRVLGGYPKPIAEKLFGGSDLEALSQDADLLVSKAISHLRAVVGFDFQSRSSPRDNLHYLGGIIHTAKLRMTLLSEYGI